MNINVIEWRGSSSVSYWAIESSITFLKTFSDFSNILMANLPKVGFKRA